MTWKWQLGVLGALVVLLAGTTLLKERQLMQVDEDTGRQQARIVDQAFEDIKKDLLGLQEDLLKEAKFIATRSEIVEALDRYVQANDPAGLQRLIRYFTTYENEDRGAVELYTAAPRLVAWKGFSMPPGEALLTPDFLDSFHIEAIDDSGIRQALVAWHPVTIEDRTIGAVRAVRLVGAKMPVENEYLQSYSLTERWKRLTRLPVQAWVQRQVSLPETVHAEGTLWPITDVEGHTLGSLYIPFPSAEELHINISERYSDLQSLWLTLIFISLIVLYFQSFEHRITLREEAAPSATFLRYTLHFCLPSLMLVGMRYVLLVLDVPARWQRGKAPLAPLFDPVHFASDFGGGLMRSMGDMFITALVGAMIAVLLLRYARQAGRMLAGKTMVLPPLVSAGMVVLATICASLIIAGLTHLLALIVNHAVLDSTVDYFARTGLLPDRLVFFVFVDMMLVTVSIMASVLGVAWLATRTILCIWPEVWRRTHLWVMTSLVGCAALVFYFNLLAVETAVPWYVILGFFAAGWGIVVFVSERPEGVQEWLHFRAALLGVLLLTLPLYALLYRGMDVQLRDQMVEAAITFDTGREHNMIFTIGQVLNDASEDGALQEKLMASNSRRQRTAMDTLAENLYRSSSLVSLLTYDVSLTLFDSTETPVGRFMEEQQSQQEQQLDREDAQEFVFLKSMLVESGEDSIFVDQVTGRREPERFQYEGLAPIYHTENSKLVGWVMARAEPRTLLRDEGRLFPKLLQPTGSNQLQGTLSLAEFQDQALVRTFGSDFGRYRMQEHVFDALKSRPEFWQTEEIGDKEYLTYYRRKVRRPFSESVTQVVPSSSTVVAVRTTLINFFDHLYYLLRMTVAGLVLCAPLYLIARLWWLRSRGWERTRFKFKDRVLNAFLVVGMLAVAIVGVVGLRVVTAENEEAIESWIKEHLNRVEESLAFQADFGELPSGTLARINVSELSNQVGLDLNVYQDKVLVATNREQLIKDRLIDERLPIEAYYALNYEGAHHAFISERVGEFEYMAGYRVLADRNGDPAFVISVPTLPEQERIKEERARTVAYLFGALLLLVVTIMLTASLLANALTGPIARLRQGLEAVARGRFERPLPVETRDEIGELVQTFNQMQEQLVESRRKLAQQERQLAWREMARQVAHEIKNPLTPMKLSVQHLRRSFHGLRRSAKSEDAEQYVRFKDLFERITTTLIEQVDALARIANEFSSFARLPKRVLEHLDLNVVLEEAVALMQEQADAVITTKLHPEPLVLEADREELRRIYINLIKNAIEATPEHKSCKVQVSTSLQSNGREGLKWAYSTVSDEGSGISPEVQDKIFEPNFSSKTSGTGLGLAIVKESIEDLQGEIGFETRKEGTTFWIRLPLIGPEN